MDLSFTRRIQGALVGTIWLPSEVCTKDLDFDCDDYAARVSGGKCTLRDFMLEATRDGDFQSCRAYDAAVRITVRVTKGARHYARHRYFPLHMFPSVADMITDGTAEGLE